MPPSDDGFPAETHSPSETRLLAADFATSLRPGDVVALFGDLGAGKTEFVRGACVALGVVGEQVSSPTFTIVNEYEGETLPVYHFDAYRIKSQDEFFEFGYQDYFGGDGVCFVEWAERIEPLLPDDAIRIRFEHAGPQVRRIVRL